MKRHIFSEIICDQCFNKFRFCIRGQYTEFKYTKDKTRLQNHGRKGKTNEHSDMSKVVVKPGLKSSDILFSDSILSRKLQDRSSGGSFSGY
jgi:hypothetical protein